MPNRVIRYRLLPILRRRGLYIGARVVVDDSAYGEIIAWDRDGNPLVERGGPWSALTARAERVTLAKGAS
jgi:hypothetical protein